MKDLRVEVRIKNNNLYQAIKSKYKSVAEFCEIKNLTISSVSNYLNFKISPFTEIRKKICKYNSVSNLLPEKRIRLTALKIVEALEVNFEDIFPEVSYEKRKNTISIEMDSDQLISFNEKIHSISMDSNKFLESFDLNELNEVIEELPDQCKYVIERRFGFYGQPQSIKEICSDLNLSSERIRQIEAKGLRLLRHPCISRRIKPNPEE